MRKPLVYYPDDRLKMVSDEVTEFDDALHTLAADLVDTMRHENGIGLSAIQIGVPKRVFVLGHDEGFAAFVNPEIVTRSEKLVDMPEGCLSFPRVYDRLGRPEAVYVRWYNLSGLTQEGQMDGLTARAFQHELDHLNGITFDKYMTETARKVLARRARREQK